MNTSQQALILEIKGNSLDDGPGVRTVVFFKGCPLSCLWCHNPESKNAGPELSFDAQKCVGCGKCREVCPKGALRLENQGYVDRDMCDLCFACAEVCPGGALSRVGRVMSPEDVAQEVEKDLPFFKTSGGGATFSGGEPTLRMDYAAKIAQVLKKKGIHILLETCGVFALERFMENLYPLVDQIYMDIKLADSKLHKRYCGANNRLILENFTALNSRAKAGGVPILPRVPLVPGITATRQNLEGIRDFLVQNQASQVALLPYNPLWPEKCAKVGQDAPGARMPGMNTWMPALELERAKAVFADFEIV